MDPNAPSTSKSTPENTGSSFNPAALAGRLPTLRNYGDLQRILSLANPATKKTFVPNLNAPRAAPVKVDTSPPEPTHKPKTRPERKLIQSEGVFSGGIESKSRKPGGGSSSQRVKHIIDNIEVKKEKQEIVDAESEQGFEEKVFRNIPADDTPVTLPHTNKNIKKEETDEEKVSELFKSLMSDSSEQGPMFLLKMPKYVPAKKENGEGCTFNDLPEGQIGKIQLFNTGKIRLILGECAFTLQEGVKVNFAEEVAVVSTENGQGEIVSLGEIEGRIVATPDNITTVLGQQPDWNSEPKK